MLLLHPQAPRAGACRGRGATSSSCCSKRQVAALARRSRRRGSVKRIEEDDAPVSEAELLQALNASHQILKPADAEDFGLEDVAAHALGRNQPKPYLPNNSSSSGSRSSKSSKRQTGAAANGNGNRNSSSSNSLEAGSPLPSWVDGLKAAGFDVLEREGELFLQRVAAPQQQQQLQQRQQQQQQQVVTALRAKQHRDQAASDSSTSSSGSDLQEEEEDMATAGVNGGGPGGEGPSAELFPACVAAEFQPSTWQRLLDAVATSASSQSQSSSAAAAAASPPGGKAAAGGAGQGRGSRAGSGASRSEEEEEEQAAVSTWLASSGLLSTIDEDANINNNSSSRKKQKDRAKSSGSKARLRPSTVQRALWSFSSPELLLQQLEGTFPAWSANGCRLVAMTAGTAPSSSSSTTRSRSSSSTDAVEEEGVVVCAPTPAEAAVALKGVAIAVKKARLRPTQIMSLARDRRILGLVECFRLTPPRLLPEQDQGITTIMWDAAKAYWLQQQPTTPPPAAAGAGNGVTAATAAAAAAAGNGAAGRQLQQQQQRALRREAFVSGMWGLAVVGGPAFFHQEMEGFLRVAALDRWDLKGRQLADVLWALAYCRHWTARLPDLEACFLKVGGLPALAPADLSSSLWGIATLGYKPVQLLQGLGGLWEQQEQQQQQMVVRVKPRGLHQQQGRQQNQQQQQLLALSSSQLCSVVWSLAVLQQVNHPAFKAAWREVLRRGMSGLQPDTRQLLQVWQCALAVKLEGEYSSESLYWDAGAEKLLTSAKAAAALETRVLQDHQLHSSYQRAMANTLASMGILHTTEDTSSGYAVDISIPQLRVGLEADGPSHMSRVGGGRRALGATLMKKRHLELMGWRVVNVTYQQWNRLTSEQEREAFLRMRLTGVKQREQQQQRRQQGEQSMSPREI